MNIDIKKIVLWTTIYSRLFSFVEIVDRKMLIHNIKVIKNAIQSSLFQNIETLLFQNSLGHRNI